MITDSALQGPILGPLLHLMFINDLPLYTNSANTDFYSDDTTLYVIGESLKTIDREGSGSVAECLTRDRGAGGSSSPESLHCGP